jgi:hypothetical protein
MDFIKGERNKLRCFWTSCLIWCFVGHQRKNRQQHCGNYMCVMISQFLKCCRNVNDEHTNPLQVHNLIPSKYLAVLEASRRILNTQCVKISVPAKVKHF